MKKVTIYTTDTCGFCTRAKGLLERHGVPFQEIDVSDDREKRVWLRDVTGRPTVPQIFFDDDSIGGCDDLERLIRTGGLDARLQRTATT
jgi:glutaredoxin 3